MSQRNILPLFCLILLFAIPAFSSSHSPPPPPPQPEMLMPAEATAVIKTTSVDDVTRLLTEFTALVSKEEGMSPEDVMFFLDDMFPPVQEIALRTSPFLLSLRMPPVMLQQEPVATAIFPIISDIEDIGFFTQDPSTMAWAQDYGCLALSTDPDYIPSETPPALLSSMLDGIVSASLDLNGLFETNRGVIEMGLGSAQMMAAADTSMAKEVSPEQVEAYVGLARVLIDSLKRLDLAVDLVDRDFNFQAQFTVAPGGMLDLGPQPDFNRALELTRLLPADADFVQASALDQSLSFEYFKEFSAMSLMNSQPDMTAEQQAAFNEWVENYYLAMMMSNAPYATSVTNDGALAIQYVVQVGDPSAALALVTKVIAGYSQLGLGIAFDRQSDSTIGDVGVSNWSLNLDSELFENEGADDDDWMQIMKMMEYIGDELHACAHDGLLFFSFDRGTEGLAAMLQQQADGGSPVNAKMAALAAKSGPACRQTAAGDLSAFVQWIGYAAGVEVARTEGQIPFSSVITSDGPVGGFELGVNLDGMGKLMAFFEAMEELEEN